ncbi:MAG: hypothetical protein C0627_04830 [Sulfurimonas sp.]|nr:MAG: hypothetical protein C0627_04830 [Sulfurimonas sp.]
MQIQLIQKENETIKYDLNIVKEKYSRESEITNNLYDKQLSTFQVILGVVGALFLLVTILGINNIKAYVIKLIDDKANNKITKLEETIKEYEKLLKEIKIKTEKDIETFLKNKTENLTSEEKELLNKLSEEIKNKQDKTANDWFVVALENHNQKNYDDAISAYKKVIELTPNNHNAHYNLALVYSSKKDYDNALDCYKKSIKDDIKFNSSFLNLFELHIIKEINTDIELVNKFIEKYKLNKAEMIKYQMLDIIKDATNNQNIDIKLKKWLETYKDTSLKGWGFTELDELIDRQTDETIKSNLQKVVEVFKNHK